MSKPTFYTNFCGEDFYEIAYPDFEEFAISRSGNIYCKLSKKLFIPRLLRQYLCHGTVYVHRLVAFTFLGNPPPDKPCVDHKNANTHDNRVENLEWVSQKENVNRSTKITSHAKRVCQHDLKSGELIRTFDSVKEAATSIDTVPSNISRVLKGKNKSAGGYFWKYENEQENATVDVDLSEGIQIKNYPNYLLFSGGRVYTKIHKRFLKVAGTPPNQPYYTLTKITSEGKYVKKNFHLTKIIAAYKNAMGTNSGEKPPEGSC